MTVKGTPVPKPDPVCYGRGGTHRLTIKTNRGYQSWRTRCTAAAAAIRDAIGHTLDGPVGVEITFTVPEPKSRPKDRLWPAVRVGDIDKMARLALDAFTDAGLWGDDSQCVDLHPVKCYPSTPHPDALPEPGALIRIWSLTHA